MTDELQIVTVCDKPPTAPYYMWAEFNKSLSRFGLTPLVLGWSEPWGGIGTKPTLLKKAIDSGQITAERILFCDAFDVVFADDPRKLPDDTTYILWNAESACFPPNEKFKEIFDGRAVGLETTHKYLNSGVSIGRTKDYLQALKEMQADSLPADQQLPDGRFVCYEDQSLWQQQYLFGNVPMQLDYFSDYFQTMHQVEPYEIDFVDGELHNRIHDTFPIIWHLNGRKEEWKPWILEKLGL